MNKRVDTIKGLIKAFGGTNSMARWTDTHQANISNWVVRGYIPASWHLRILIEASRRNIEIAPSVFDLSEEDYEDLRSFLRRKPKVTEAA